MCCCLPHMDVGELACDDMVKQRTTHAGSNPIGGGKHVISVHGGQGASDDDALDRKLDGGTKSAACNAFRGAGPGVACDLRPVANGWNGVGLGHRKCTNRSYHLAKIRRRETVVCFCFMDSFITLNKTSLLRYCPILFVYMLFMSYVWCLWHFKEDNIMFTKHKCLQNLDWSNF